MVRVDFYEIAFKAENSTYSFELPAIPRIGEHLTVADGMGGICFPGGFGRPARLFCRPKRV